MYIYCSGFTLISNACLEDRHNIFLVTQTDNTNCSYLSFIEYNK